MFPKVELHVHFEGTIRTAVPHEPRYRDLDHFIEAFMVAASSLRTRDDFRRVVVDYAGEAAAHGAVYIEGIFVPGLRREDVDSAELFAGYCDGAEEARAVHGVEVRLTPDIPRVYSEEEALETVHLAARFRDRGVVGVGLGGTGFPPSYYRRAFEAARAEGLAAVPHAGELEDDVRDALALEPTRIRHGIRAASDPELLQELVDRGIVLDVCPISNVCTGAVASLEQHPLPTLVAAGVRCSISTDDPALFGTDLSRDYAAAEQLGLDARTAFENGLAGALIGEETRQRLRDGLP